MCKYVSILFYSKTQQIDKIKQNKTFELYLRLLSLFNQPSGLEGNIPELLCCHHGDGNSKDKFSVSIITRFNCVLQSSTWK